MQMENIICDCHHWASYVGRVVTKTKRLFINDTNRTLIRRKR